MAFKNSSTLFYFLFICGGLALPLVRREVPQEHSHEPFLTSVRASLALNNPAGIVDPVFGLLGNAAAAGGAGKIIDITCLQQATADQAFTNAKKAGNIQAQVDALIYRALERNSGKVGLATDLCTSIEAVNPEVAVIQQHQDPASQNATAINRAITFELARQIAAIGGNPQDALKAGTFKPGSLNDNTGKGNTCDDANDAAGCIFSQGLLVPDATAAEINAAVAGAAPADGATPSTALNSSSIPVATCPPASTVTVTISNTPTGTAPSTAATFSLENLQKFSGALGGAAAPAVTSGGRGFVVASSDSFLNLPAALGRSCDIQHNECANVANSASGRGAGLTVGQCDQQNNACHSIIA